MQRLSALDAAFLQLEDEVQPMHVGSLLVLEGPAPTLAELTEHVASCLDRLPRHRQRVQRMPFDLARPAWVDDPRFRLERHLRHTAVASPGGGDELRAVFARVLEQPLDLDRPLWELWLVDRLAGGRWALFTKTHHAMVDGLAGGEVMEALLQPDPDSVLPEPVPWHPSPAPTRLEVTASGVVGLARLPLDAGLVLGGLARRGVTAPRSLAAAGAARLAGLVRLGHDAVTPTHVLNGPLGPHRRWGWARAELADVKRVKVAAGCSVNDVVLAAVAGGFRRHLLARGEDVSTTTIRSLVPVSVRTEAHRGGLGNHVSAMFAELPVTVADPRERLEETARRMRRLKTGGEAQGVESALAAADLVPATLMTLGARAYARTGQRVVNTVTTNVPGPPHPLYLRGRRMLELFPWIPVAEGVRISIGILSYDGHVTVGVTADYDAVPDVDVLCAGIEASFEELVATVADGRPVRV